MEHGPAPSRPELHRGIDELVDECRSTCLWYLRADYHPHTDDERLRVLDAIQKRADRDAFARAATLKRWLSLLSSSASAGS